MTKKTAPQWQPIERLPLITHHIDGMLESASEQHANLLQARPKPYGDPYLTDDEIRWYKQHLAEV